VLRAEAGTRLGALTLDVALEVPAGRCLALAGPSGAGKSSVLRVVAGLLRPERGRVECGGRTWLDTERGVNLAPERRRCGYLFQEYALFGHLRAWQNVAYGMDGVPRRERRARSLALLERFGMGALADARPRTLSGGERQRVAIARALVGRPALVLADEPTGNLDSVAGNRILELLLELHAGGATIAVITHDREVAHRLGRKVVLRDGRIEDDRPVGPAPDGRPALGAGLVPGRAA
jgi:ABC-type sulfate/molybdate transport systems ATPase subunit